jgi:hypothetical protein
MQQEVTMTVLDGKLHDNITESWLCVDCGVNTHPGTLPGDAVRREIKAKGQHDIHVGPDSEVYMVRPAIWEKAGMEPMGGCLCIGCIERRLGRQLRRTDFDWKHPFNDLPGTDRLMERRYTKRWA